jgi:hypothetical protein
MRVVAMDIARDVYRATGGAELFVGSVGIHEAGYGTTIQSSSVSSGKIGRSREMTRIINITPRTKRKGKGHTFQPC